MAEKRTSARVAKKEEQDRPALLTSLRNQKKEIQQARFRRSVGARQGGDHRTLRRRNARTLTTLTSLKKRQ